MAARNDKRKRAAREQDIKQVEKGVNVLVKLGCLVLVGSFVYLESTKPGTINVLAWAFLFGAFFGKEALDKFLGGRQ